jgi:hypothetical protein
MVGSQVDHCAGLSFAGPKRPTDRNPMARMPFASPEARIVVSTEGYFDVYPPTERTSGDKPAYRGRLAELGTGIRGIDDRLAVRPDSAVLARAVAEWSTLYARDAMNGTLGRGRDGNEVEA